jgi:hypothetical protein
MNCAARRGTMSTSLEQRSHALVWRHGSPQQSWPIAACRFSWNHSAGKPKTSLNDILVNWIAKTRLLNATGQLRWAENAHNFLVKDRRLACRHNACRSCVTSAIWTTSEDRYSMNQCRHRASHVGHSTGLLICPAFTLCS